MSNFLLWSFVIGMLTLAIAVALKEAETPEFKKYAKQIVKNAKVLAETLMENGFRVITGGSDNHLILVDVTPHGVGGKKMAKALNMAGIVVNMNTIPFFSHRKIIVND